MHELFGKGIAKNIHYAERAKAVKKSVKIILKVLNYILLILKDIYDRLLRVKWTHSLTERVKPLSAFHE